MSLDGIKVLQAGLLSINKSGVGILVISLFLSVGAVRWRQP